MNRPHVCGKRAGLEKNARVRWLLGFVLFAITLASAPAQDLTSALIPPSKPVAAGSKCGLSLFCMNNSPVDITATFPRQLTGEFSAGPQKLNALLLLDTNTLEDDTVTIQSGSFAKREYVMEVPSLVTNQLVLTISNYTPIIIIVGNAPAEPHVTTEPPPEPVTPNLMETNQQHFSKIVTHFSKYLTPYEPIYFLLGTYPASEFQFSLKYQLFDTTNRWLYPASRLHFAYTQTSFWDLFSKDPSFYDTSYKPSAFFYFQDLLETRREQDYQLDFQTGYEHESNGRGGTDERSQNTAYVQPTLTIGLPEDFQVSLYPRAWVYIFGTSANNPDIADYRGHADFVGTLSWRKNYQLTTKFTIGDHPDRTSVKLDFSFALPRSTGFTPRIHAQYFGGYGESLRQYNQTSHSFRVGISLFD